MTAIDPKFRTKNNRLNAYSFACGYIEQKSTNHDNFRNGDLYTEMYHEGACYHVRQFDRRPGAKTFRVFWESFDTLTEARKLFDKQEGILVSGKSPAIGTD
jgi:hypothetical protein